MRRWSYKPARDIDLAPGERFAAVRREPGLVSTALHAIGLALGRLYMRLVHGFVVEGRARIPDAAPLVLVANHSSHVDVFALSAALPWRLALRSYPLAAGDVFFERLGRSILTAFFINALPVWRKRPKPADLALMRARLTEERCVFILFPEGARSRDGAMLPFKPGIGMLVAGTSVPVVPCHIEGAFAAWPPGRALPRLRRVRVTIGAPLTFETEPDAKAGWLTTASRLEDSVKHLAL
jgi:1-acyl-sn-glycerol-3-phosphate acyltransferase